MLQLAFINISKTLSSSLITLYANALHFVNTRVNLTLNRDKDDFDDSPDDLPEEPDTRKTILQHQAPKAPSKAKQLTTRSRSVLGCDQIGIETLVSMLSSGGSDSEKEETQHAQTPPTPKPETSRTRTNMLRKTGGLTD